MLNKVNISLDQVNNTLEESDNLLRSQTLEHKEIQMLFKFNDQA